MARPGPSGHVVPLDDSPLDDSLPDVCVARRACLARHVRSEGGMGKLLGGLVLQWVLYAVAWTAGVIWWWGPPGLVLMSAVTLVLLLTAAVVYGRQGHRGWCRLLRSLDPGEIAEAVLLTPLAWIERLLVWILWPFRRIAHLLVRLIVWIWRCLSALGNL
ncbi:hypothetical protein HNP84_007624 [Thermocatellispora tengchongensis]|uniref:Uncharacterized protein n=1 Tax=Thermocatellispora tengchongensis TaxID=1073253 RepID=A0A840PJ79_9ACTN|nr:hypothetical protein [Thermocatellispora tengchongensis]MBB5137871.1 hypothetical protein [Thermocatellispora tengchongensis]